MTRIAFQALVLMGVYLLVLTSVQPGDALVGLILGAGLAVALRPRAGEPRSSGLARLVALVPVLFGTVVEMARGSWRTARFCLGVGGGGRPGFVEIPRAGRSPHAVALWGMLTGEAPDEVPVDVDEERDVLIVHLVDASDPDAIRDRHRRAWESGQRRAVG
jgi:multisubunit Na+/H+ antiporter MnhE subunit